MSVEHVRALFSNHCHVNSLRLATKVVSYLRPGLPRELSRSSLVKTFVALKPSLPA